MSAPTSRPKVHILFAGYAQVHFVSFLPIYRELIQDPRLEIWLTGGFRSQVGRGDRFDLDGFYDPFGVPEERILPHAEARKRKYHILFCSHVSRVLAPKHAEVRIQLFHDLSFRDGAITAEALEFDYLFLSGEAMRRRFIDLRWFGESDPRLMMTGFAKLDRLVDGSLDRVQTLRGLGLDPARKTVVIAATGHSPNLLDRYGPHLFTALLEGTEANVLVLSDSRAEGTPPAWPPLTSFHGDRVRVVQDPDSVPYLHASDLLITDASSISSEYAILDRPIVFMDVPELLNELEERGIPLASRVWSREGGVTIDDTGLLAETVEALLRGEGDGDRGARQEIARDTFHAPGTATRRAVRAVNEIIELLGPVPAAARERRCHG